MFDEPMFDERALIGVIHVQALPGTPASRLSVERIAEIAADEARIYTDAGFHGVMIENTHKHLERNPGAPKVRVIVEACREVGPALFFSMLVITVSFLPVFTLEAQEGRLFKPLAYTKTFAMAGAALLSLTMAPALMVLFVRGRIVPEARNPLNRFLIWAYRPVIRGSPALRQPKGGKTASAAASPIFNFRCSARQHDEVGVDSRLMADAVVGDD